MLDEYKIISSKEGIITPEELKKAKEFLKGHLVLELEDSRSVAGFFAGQELLEKKIDKPEDVLLKIDKVTSEEIKSVAQKYIQSDSLNLAVIGDFKKDKQLEAIIND